MLDPEELANEDITDNDLKDILNAPDTSTEVTKRTVEGPTYTSHGDEDDEEPEDEGY